MTVINASTDAGFNPANPTDYVTAMANAATQMQNSTFQSVGSVLAGLPTISQLAQGGYGFVGSTVQQENSLFQQNTAATQNFMNQNVGQILPVVSGIAQSAAQNQQMAIQAENNVAAATASSGGKK